jgi:Putative Actinobacterial Holin-X, holin superfamily III
MELKQARQLALVSIILLFMQMDDLKEKTADLADHVEDLADTFYKLTVVKITEKATTIASNVILVLSITIFGFFILLFSGIALAWWLGDLVNSRTAGFLLGAGFFLLVLLIIAALKKKTIFPYIRDRIIRKVYE